jgi:hypothetical protein
MNSVPCWRLVASNWWVNPATSKRPFAVRMDTIVAEHLFGGGHDRNADVDHL